MRHRKKSHERAKSPGRGSLSKIPQYRGTRFWSLLLLGGNAPNGISLSKIKSALIERSTGDRLEYVPAELIFLSQFGKASYGRRLAYLMKGSFAMVPADAREGDLICALYECEYPVVLRPIDCKASRYRFIGRCHAVSGILLWEGLSPRLERFHLV